jgi:hypothetical protein
LRTQYKDEKWLVLVWRPSLAAISVGGRGRPPHCTEARPTDQFSYIVSNQKAIFVILSASQNLSLKAAEIRNEAALRSDSSSTVGKK